MKIKEIINYRVKVKNINKNKALMILIVFFIIMFGLTLLSRFSDSLTIPLVTTEKVSSQSINKNVQVDGAIMESKEINIEAVEGLTVDSVNVNIGSNVKAGDILVQFNLEEITNKLNEINKEINDNNKAYTRAVEDYNVAKSKLEKDINILKSDVDSLKSALDSAEDPTERNELKTQYDAKVKEYNEAINSKEETLLTNKRAIEDSEVGNKNDTLNEQAKSLSAIKEKEGKLISDKDGYITNIIAKAGEKTTGGAIISMADNSSDYKFTAQISKDQKKKIRLGQKVSLSLTSSEMELIENLEINSISVNTEDKEMYDVVVNVPSGKANVGDTATLKVENDDSNTALCVPVEALHYENNRYYVLVMSERDTVLGSEEYAMKVDLQIKDKDDKYAALKDFSLSSDQEVIVSSNKSIKEGDRVRKETR